MVAVISAEPVLFGHGIASSNFIIRSRPALGDQTLTDTDVDPSKEKGVGTVILDPPHGCPGPFTSSNTEADVLPLESGFAITAVVPPSNPSKVNSVSKVIGVGPEVLLDGL